MTTTHKTHQHYLDHALQGHAQIFEGTLDMVAAAKYGNTVLRGNGIRPDENSFHGRPEIKGWDDVAKCLSTPSIEDVTTVKDFIEELKATNLPVPKSRKRKPRWDENEGEVDVDRIMAGEPGYNRLIRRDNTTGPTTVALFCNLDGNSTQTGIFWRGAAGIAAADLLEDAGYAVEMWLWNVGTSVFPRPYSNQFIASRIKNAGDPLDVDTLVCSLSPWFMRTAVFGAFAADGARSVGGATSDMGLLGKWIKYCDVGENVRRLVMPIVNTKEGAAECARWMLERIVKNQE